jgi:hypothetical protein
VAKAARTLALYVVLGFAGGVLLAIALPLAFDGRPLVVLSGAWTRRSRRATSSS